MLPLLVDNPATLLTVPTVKPSVSTIVNDLPEPVTEAATVVKLLPPWPRFTSPTAVMLSDGAERTPPV